MITAIFSLKTSLAELAAECLELFGEGARTEDCGEAYWFRRNSTRVEHGYVRIPMLPHMAVGLDYVVNDLGYVSPNADLIRIEPFGQDMVQTGTDEDGQPIIEEQLFQVGMTEPLTLEDGTVIPERPIYLGRMA